MIQELFSRVSSYYDVMNDVMSLGYHRLWKNEFVKLVPSYSSCIIDIAGGTGDIASRLLEKGHTVYVCDISEEMMRKGRAKIIDKGILHHHRWDIADAKNLPYPNETADAVTMVFGLRNIHEREKALQEVYRVLKPGGIFLCMEFCPNPDILGYPFYLNKIIPLMGQVIAHDFDAYHYLATSIQNFWTPEEVLMNMSHFQETSCTFLSKGIVAIYQGMK